MARSTAAIRSFSDSVPARVYRLNSVPAMMTATPARAASTADKKRQEVERNDNSLPKIRMMRPPLRLVGKQL